MRVDVTDGLVKVYQLADPVTGVAGIYRVSIDDATQESDIDFRVEGLNILSSGWYNSPLDEDAAAIQLRDYLNSNHSNILTAISSGSDVTVTFLSPSSFDTGETGVTVSNVSAIIIQVGTTAVLSSPGISKNLQIGVISSVDVAASKVKVYNGDIIRVTADEDIVVDVLNPLKPVFAGSDGRAIFGEMDDDTVLGFLGIPIGSADEGESLFIKKLPITIFN